VEGKGDRLMFCEDGEMTSIQYVVKVPHGFVYPKKLPLVRAELPLCRTELLERKARGCQTPSNCCWRTVFMVDVEAFVTRASGVVA
jgi:hypothetical protein